MSFYRMAVAAGTSEVAENGLKAIEPGEYRLMCGEFREVTVKSAVVLKFLVAGRADGSESEFDGRQVDLWLSAATPQQTAIARDRLLSLGLTFHSFESPEGKLAELLTVRAIVTAKTFEDGVTRNDIGKIVEVISRESQAPRSDSLQEL